MSRFDGIKSVDVYPTSSHERYTLGKKSDDFSQIKDIQPVFSFRYICTDNSDFSFCSKFMNGARDYQKLLKSIKEKCSLKYGQLDSCQNQHFHEIDWSDVSIKESDFNKCIRAQHEGMIGDIDVTPYQFKVFEEARVIGFIYKTVFYAVMLDRGHKAYKRK